MVVVSKPELLVERQVLIMVFVFQLKISAYVKIGIEKQSKAR